MSGSLHDENESANMARIEEKALDSGCYVFQPKSNQLTLDIDTVEQYDQFCQTLQEVRSKDLLPIASIKVSASKSGMPHRHVVINLDAPKNPPGPMFSPLEMVALQLIFGSDPVREMLTAWRCLSGYPESGVLFRPLPRSRDENSGFITGK